MGDPRLDWTSAIMGLIVAAIAALSVRRHPLIKIEILPLNSGWRAFRGLCSKLMITFAGMWGTILTLAFLAAFDPVRLGVILLVISRPRPIPNMLAYTAGCLVACSYMLVLPLVVLNATPIQKPDTTTMQHFQIAAGVVTILIAGLMMLKFSVRRPTLTENNVLQRIGDRAKRAWETGGWWMALAIGVATGGPPWNAVALLLAVIVLSGAAASVQVAAAAVFVVGMLAVAETILIAHLINPHKAQHALRNLRDWVFTHRREAVAALTAIAGASLVASGIIA